MSFTSGKISHDPMPYVWPNVESRLTSGPLRSMFSHGDGIALTYAPRPEFDNHNPILVAFRATELPIQYDDTMQAVAGWWVDRLNKYTPVDATDAQAEHARRVLTKLAALA